VPSLKQQPAVADAKSKSSEPPPPRPAVLTRRGADILVRVERMMDDAQRALGPSIPTVSTEKKKQVSTQETTSAVAAALEDRPLGSRN
jgi:penicillin-binding protein 1A